MILKNTIRETAIAAVYILVIIISLFPPLDMLGMYSMAGGKGDTYNALLINYSIIDCLSNGNIIENPVSYGMNYPAGRKIFDIADPGFPLISYIFFIFLKNHFSALNIPVLLCIFLLALVIDRFSRIFLRSRLLSFLTGLMSIFSFPLLAVIWDGTAERVMIFMIFLFLIFYLRFRNRTDKQALLLGLTAGILTVYCSTYIYLALLFVLFDMSWEILVRKRVWKNIRFSLVLLAGLMIISGARYLLQPPSEARMRHEKANTNGMNFIRTVKDLRGINSYFNAERFLDLCSLLLPIDATAFNKKSSAFSMPEKQRFEGTCYFGLHLIVFGLIGLWRIPFRDKKKLIFILIMFLLISAGPYFIWKSPVTVNTGWGDIAVLLPYALLVKLIPLLKHVRHPGQAIFIVYYYFMVFSVYGVYSLAGLFKRRTVLKYAFPILLVMVQLLSVKTMFASLMPLHMDEKEGHAFFQALRNSGDRFRVAYIDSKIQNSFPEINNRDFVVYTSAVHQKQSIMLYNDADLSIYNILAGINAPEKTDELMLYLKNNAVKYIVFFNNENEDMRGYSRQYMAQFQTIRKYLNGLFSIVYKGHAYNIYSTAY